MPFLIRCHAIGPSHSNLVPDPNIAHFELDGSIVEQISSKSDSASYEVVSTPANQHSKTVFLIVRNASIARDHQKRYGCYQGDWDPRSINDTTLVQVIPADGKIFPGIIAILG